MISLKKRMLVLAAAGVLAVTSLTGCGSSVNNDAAVSTVGEEKIPFGVANFYARMQQAQYETYYAGMMGTSAEDMWKQQVDKDKTYEEMVKEGVMNNLEDVYLVDQHAKDYKVELTKEEQEAIKKAAEKFVADNDEKTRKAISGSEEYITELLEKLTLQNKMTKEMTADVDQNVSDDEAAQKAMDYVFFSFKKTLEDGSVEDMTAEEKAEVKEKAQTVREAASSMSSNHSLEEAAKTQEVELKKATFDKETTSIDAEFIKAADSLKENELSEVIETASGLYIGQITSLLDREATDAKKETIINERKSTKYQELLETWKKETKIDRNKKVWKKINFDKTGVTIKQKSEE